MINSDPTPQSAPHPPSEPSQATASLAIRDSTPVPRGRRPGKALD